MATDLAEVIGGAIALHLLFGLPLLTGGLITAVVAFALLGLQGRATGRSSWRSRGCSRSSRSASSSAPPSPGVDGGEVAGGLVPTFAGVDSVLLATGILGATVMPHVIYLHSALTQDRIVPVDARRAAVAAAGRSASTWSSRWGSPGWSTSPCWCWPPSSSSARPVTGVDTLEGAHAALERIAGAPVAFAFAVALLASGFASSGVGTYAGQVVMRASCSGRSRCCCAARSRWRRRWSCWRRGRPDPGPGAQPGGAVVRHPVRARAAGAADPAGRRHGRRWSTGRVTTAAAWVVAALVIALNALPAVRDPARS